MLPSPPLPAHKAGLGRLAAIYFSATEAAERPWFFGLGIPGSPRSETWLGHDHTPYFLYLEIIVVHIACIVKRNLQNFPLLAKRDVV